MNTATLRTAPKGDAALSAVFLALADPTRRAMLKELARGERTLTELAAPFAISVPAVNKHLRTLERAGLIARSRRAQSKPCTLRFEPLLDAGQWIAQYRAEWEGRLNRLEAFVIAQQQQEETKARRTSGKSCDPASRRRRR